MKILIYEDNYCKNLFPLSMLRGVYDIRVGTNTIKERIEKINDGKYEIVLHCREDLAEYLKDVHKNKINKVLKDDYLLLNGRFIFTNDAFNFLIKKKDKNTFYVFKDEVVAAYITKDKFEAIQNVINEAIDRNFFERLSLNIFNLKDDFKVNVIKYPWDIIHYILGGGLKVDFEYFDKKKFAKAKNRDHFINHKNIFISKDASISPNIVINASSGIVVIDDDVTIEPFTFIKGPAYIGKNCLLKSGTKIYGPCVVGEYSKVAGEIAESIFHSYVNKQHDGFIGHSYLCPFINLGADTVTSDLKNNYSVIKINIGNEEVNTGMQFLGSIIGDHSKTSINTMLNTGSVIGIFANIFGGGFPDKVITSFSWNEAGKNSTKYDIEKALETAKSVMQRRGIEMSKAYENLVKSYYD